MHAVIVADVADSTQAAWLSASASSSRRPAHPAYESGCFEFGCHLAFGAVAAVIQAPLVRQAVDYFGQAPDDHLEMVFFNHRERRGVAVLVEDDYYDPYVLAKVGGVLFGFFECVSE
jgi:hypothetical protein